MPTVAGFQTPAPYFHSYFKIHLKNRKGWQRKTDGHDGPLPCWIRYLEQLVGHPLQPDDYIFPYFAANGIPHLDREMTHDMVQNCFRRGGAQYRFMDAPIGQRWSICKIRWWGGWAAGEHVDTLIRYLIDSLQSYKTDYSNALCPLPTEADQSFMGDHILKRPLNVAEFRVFSTAVMTGLQAIANGTKACPGHKNTSQIEHKLITAPHMSSPIWQTTSNDNSVEEQFCDSPKNPDMTPTPLQQPPRPLPAPLPIGGVRIPDLGRQRGSWRTAVKQWNEIDPKTGYALKDWPDAWYTGRMRVKTATKHSQRALIATEYERLGGTDTGFLAAYPNADSTPLRNLLKTIRTQCGRLRPPGHHCWKPSTTAAAAATPTDNSSSSSSSYSSDLAYTADSPSSSQ